MLTESTSTVSTAPECKHDTGWIHYVKFWIFEKKFIACEECGRLVPLSKWGLGV
jgi:hypothetical protein